MIFYIVIPAYNEAAHIERTLRSLAEQTLPPKKIVVVNDGSTDQTAAIVDAVSANYPFISQVHTNAESGHAPGAKVVSAFNIGLKTLDSSFDIIGKFDADIILPPNYFERMRELFASDPKTGIAGGNLYVQEDARWVYENISAKTKVRGPIKLYRKECFYAIGGLKKSIGWDTVDELLAQYHGWQIVTDKSLHVKHLKPTGKAYSKSSRHLQGEAFYKMRYGFLLALIGITKQAINRKSLFFFINSTIGYIKAGFKRVPRLVTPEEGKHIRSFRWSRIYQKLKP